MEAPVSRVSAASLGGRTRRGLNVIAAPILAGRHAVGGLELADQMTLVGEAGRHRGSRGGLAREQQRLRMTEPKLRLIGMRRQAIAAAESAQQRDRREAGDRRQVAQRYLCRERAL